MRAAILPLLRALTLTPMVQDGGQVSGHSDDQPEDETADDPGVFYWTIATADELVSEISTRSRPGLRAICESAPVASFDTVLEALGTDGPTAGGVMGSISYAAKRMDAPLPFTRDYRKRVYLIDPDVATVILGAIERAEQLE